VTQGIITEGMRLKLGPFEDGSFRLVSVTSIKRNRAPCRLVRATQSAALALNISYHKLRKGMVLVDARSGNEIYRDKQITLISFLGNLNN
jgi:GTPase